MPRVLRAAFTTGAIALAIGAPAQGGPQRAAGAATADTLSGVLTVRSRLAADEPVRRSRLRFALTARGDVRILGDPDSGDVYFDARSATQVTLNAPGTGGTLVERGLAYGPPDAGPAEHVLQGGLAATTRALAAAGDASVAESEIGGRPAWALRTRTPVNKLGYTGDRLEIAVDRATGLALFAQETFRGRLVRDLRVSNLRVDRRFTRRSFAPRRPSGRETTVIDGGFRTRTLRQSAGRAGYAPLVPRTLPDGFRRAQTRFAERTQPTGTEGLNPPSRGVVSTAYRRGFDRVLVTTRRRLGSDRRWSDPISAGEGFRVSEARIRLARGALAGQTARLVIDPRAIPHVWILSRDLVVTISGPLSRAELIAAAESLAEYTRP